LASQNFSSSGFHSEIQVGSFSLIRDSFQSQGIVARAGSPSLSGAKFG
jgi:hypothetical protein